MVLRNQPRCSSPRRSWASGGEEGSTTGGEAAGAVRRVQGAQAGTDCWRPLVRPKEEEDRRGAARTVETGDRRGVETAGRLHPLFSP